VFDGDELMLISDMGTLVRTKGDEVSVLGRNTQGVRLIKLRNEEMLNSVSRIEEQEESPEEDGDDGSPDD
jgi:DNA gyrase subunit A